MIKSNNNQSIQLTFDSFNLEDIYGRCGDYVEISNGSFTEKFCMGPLPGPITSSTGEMTVKFNSDSYETRTGFFAVVCCSVNVTTDAESESSPTPLVQIINSYFVVTTIYLPLAISSDK